MTTELIALAWALMLALVHLFAATGARNRETGLAYNAGARDQPGPPVGVVTGRLQRAQANFYESLPLFIGAVAIAGIAGRHNAQTAAGAWLFVGARALYLPVYAAGVPYVRTLVWAAGLTGIGLVLLGALHGR